jgi:hypothetical protein
MLLSLSFLPLSLWELITAIIFACLSVQANRDSHVTRGRYRLVDNYEGVGFFDKFDFITVCLHILD